MRLGLTNTIAARGTPIGGDGLALDLQFALDKTTTARIGPTPVFTRASSGTFVGSDGLIQSAGSNVARFDHDPVTLASRGLLIEESRTNAALQSGTIVHNTGWVVSQAATGATSATSGTGPDSNTSYLISETATTSAHGLYNTGTNTASIGASVTSGTAYTASCFVKKVAGSIDWIQIGLGTGGFGSTQYANFNLTTGQFGNSSGLTTRVEAHANGWYRISITANATSTTSTTATFGLNFINNTNGTSVGPSYAGSTSNQFLLAMCQFEAGAFPTSYTPTTTASVVRSADVCSITGAAFSGFYNQPEGTLFADVTPQAVAQSAWVLGVNTSTFNNQHGLYKTDSAFNAAGRRWGASTTSGTTPQSSIVTSTDVAAARSRLAYAYKLNDMAFAAIGSLVGTDTIGTMPTSTAMRIGSRDDGLAINGHLAAVRYFRKRLDNAKLQSITV